MAEKKDITADGGKAITAEAKTWKGTSYVSNGAAATKGVGGDCSGTTQKIYDVAGYSYPYQQTSCFTSYALKSGLFRELGTEEKKQEGDILWWSGHMAIYSSFAFDSDNATTERTNAQGIKWTQHNDMWSASHPGGVPYSPAVIKFWRSDAPRVFRYQV